MFSYPPERLERVATRVLCLGNPLLADDAFGAAVAAALPGCVPPEVEVVRSEVTGFGLLDDLLNTGRVICVPRPVRLPTMSGSSRCWLWPAPCAYPRRKRS